MLRTLTALPRMNAAEIDLNALLEVEHIVARVRAMADELSHGC
jgi:hypothetical protein